MEKEVRHPIQYQEKQIRELQAQNASNQERIPSHTFNFHIQQHFAIVNETIRLTQRKIDPPPSWPD